MSVSPDDPSFLSGLLGQNGTLSNSMNGNPLMGLAMGLLQAGGPSRMPVSLGQALGAGMQSGQQFQSQGIQNAMQRLMLGQNIQGMQAMQQANSGGDAPIPAAFQQYAPQGQPSGLPPQPNAAAPQVAPAIGTSAASASNGLPAQNQQSATQPTQSPPWLSQVAEDNKKLNILSSMPMNDKLTAAANDLRTRMQNTWYPVPPNMVKGGAVPGQQQYVNELGEPKTVGDPAIKIISVPGPNGTMVNVPWDTRTNKVSDVGGALSQKDYTKPLTPALEQQAQAVAQYRQLPPTVSSRYPGAADIRARANQLIIDAGGQGLDDTTFPSKMTAMKSLSSGKDYQQNSAYSTIQTHMQTLDDAMSALNNGDVQDANKLTQWAGKKLGNSAPQNAKVVNDIVVGELAKVLAQGGMVTDSVRNEAAGDLEPYLSKGQYKGATDYIRQLIAGKMNTSYINAKASHIPDDVFMSHLSPEARQQLQIFQQQHPDNGTANGAPKVMNYDPATGKIQ